MSVVSNEAVKAAAEETSKELVKPEPVEEPATVPTFSPHIDHASIHYGKAQIEARGYELGIATLEAELRGITERADAEVTRIEAETEEEIAEIADRARRRVARLREDLVMDAANLNRRISDLKDTRAMLVAQIEAYRQIHPETQETKDAEPDPEPNPAGTGEDGGGAGHSGQ